MKNTPTPFFVSFNSGVSAVTGLSWEAKILTETVAVSGLKLCTADVEAEQERESVNCENEVGGDVEQEEVGDIVGDGEGDIVLAIELDVEGEGDIVLAIELDVEAIDWDEVGVLVGVWVEDFVLVGEGEMIMLVGEFDLEAAIDWDVEGVWVGELERDEEKDGEGDRDVPAGKYWNSQTADVASET